MDNGDKQNPDIKKAGLEASREITLAYVTAGLTDQKPAQVLRDVYKAYAKIIYDNHD